MLLEDAMRSQFPLTVVSRLVLLALRAANQGALAQASHGIFVTLIRTRRSWT